MNDYVQSGLMKVKFENEAFHLNLANKRCILLVSVGQKYHEGDRLCSTVELINKSNFSSCDIVVADSLQRHNYLDMSPQEAYDHSVRIGDDWLKRNKNILNNLLPDTRIIRWDTPLQDKNYAEFKGKVQKEYENNKAYQDAVNCTISYFTARVRERDKVVDIKKIFPHCLIYLLEECPIIMPLWASQGYDYIIYPKPMTQAMAMTQAIFVEKNYPNKGQWLSLKFKKLSRQMNEQQDYLLGNQSSLISEIN